MMELHWLPEMPDWRARLRGLANGPASIWQNAVALAGARINFVLTNALDETLHRLLSRPPDHLATKPVRLAVLGSSTLTHTAAHAIPGRRFTPPGIWIETPMKTTSGNTGRRLSGSETSALNECIPTAVLLALDARELTARASQPRWTGRPPKRR